MVHWEEDKPVRGDGINKDGLNSYHETFAS